MPAAVEVQELAQARPRRPAPPMPAPRAPLAHQPGRLQRLLHERVGHRHAVLTPGDLIEVPHVEPGVPVARSVAVAVEREQPLHLGQRHRPRRGRALPVVVDPREPVLLVAPAQPTHRASADAQHLRHVNPGLPSAERLHEDLVNLHGPLHCSLGVGHPHLLGGHDSPAAGWERSDHLLSGADRSCTPDSLRSAHLPTRPRSPSLSSADSP